LYNRLAESRGLDAEEHKKNVFGSEQKKELKQQEVTLRDLVDKKFDRFVKEKKVAKRDDLIDNFHWILMRARRNKKLTVSQLAKEIGESERFVKMAEQGVLPEGDYRSIHRLETVLSINILRPEVAKQLEQQRKQLGFDEMTARTLTISDLQDMKKEGSVLNQEKKIPYWRRVMSRIISKENPTMEDEIKVLVDEDGDNIPIAPEQKEREAEVETEEGEDLEFEERGDSSIEFDETSLEIGDVTISESEVEKEVEKKEDELTQEEIDEIIYGKKK
jgi:ribosome-binding protein aMBF1 (putative translation factor)